MANTTAILSGSIDLESIDKSKLAKGKYLNFDILLSDESKYGNNGWIVQSQTKEEREAKTPKTSLGNGGVRWINPESTIVVAEKDTEVTNKVQNEAREVDLPF